MSTRATLFQQLSPRVKSVSNLMTLVLEDLKTTLHEPAILPMNRHELFSRGNLLRPCKGILLFEPPGTKKTLLAKAVATEPEANFISITGSTFTSKALFSFASKLAPVIVFVDEVDSLLGARGGGFEHEATRRMRNVFMAAWDGLRSSFVHYEGGHSC